jgi:uncharacterized protein (TIGR03000 family)
MRSNKPIGSVIVFLSGAVFLGSDQPVRAQLMSKWGHPVFTFGSTPYDSVNTGHGYYSGSPGFIPGYGYYPGAGPGTYPWMDGPGTPFDRRKLGLVVPSLPPAEAIPSLPLEEEPPAGAALIIVKIPAEAELWFDDQQTSAKGSYRRFVTPILAENRTLFYTLRVRWPIKGVELTRVEKVPVVAGGRITVNFLTVDGWTGMRQETLPPPRGK